MFLYIIEIQFLIRRPSANDTTFYDNGDVIGIGNGEVAGSPGIDAIFWGSYTDEKLDAYLSYGTGNRLPGNLPATYKVDVFPKE